MSIRTIRKSASFAALAAVIVLALAAMTQQAGAVPSFARQTGLACEACHTVFPELTPFGRAFKASGYTLFNTRKVQDIDRQKHNTLSITDLPPVSAMVMASTSMEAKANDDQSSKTSTDFPQQMSLFYAGHISDNVGAFIQVTYDDQSGSFGMDNTDIRFADVGTVDGHEVIYGVSLNNNPTVQDLWNDTPAWSQPFIASPALQGPAASTQLEGAMAQNVAGLSAYAFIDESLYAETGVYRTALQGASVASSGSDNNMIISGVAPYWRVAYEDDWGKNSFEVGTSGLYAELENPTTPAGNAINLSLQHGLTDKFMDVALDSQYQYIDDNDQISVTSRWVHEHENLDASFMEGFADRKDANVDTFNLTGSYFWKRMLGGSIGFTTVSSSKDPLYFGTVQGGSNSSYGTVEADYLPWLNVKLGLQYTAFAKFDGLTSNYDGNGRNASDNNMLFGYLWVAY